MICQLLEKVNQSNIIAICPTKLECFKVMCVDTIVSVKAVSVKDYSPSISPWCLTDSAARIDLPEPAMPKTVIQPGSFWSR